MSSLFRNFCSVGANLGSLVRLGRCLRFRWYARSSFTGRRWTGRSSSQTNAELILLRDIQFLTSKKSKNPRIWSFEGLKKLRWGVGQKKRGKCGEKWKIARRAKKNWVVFRVGTCWDEVGMARHPWDAVWPEAKKTISCHHLIWVYCGSSAGKF